MKHEKNESPFFAAEIPSGNEVNQEHLYSDADISLAYHAILYKQGVTHPPGCQFLIEGKNQPKAEFLALTPAVDAVDNKSTSIEYFLDSARQPQNPVAILLQELVATKQLSALDQKNEKKLMGQLNQLFSKKADDALLSRVSKELRYAKFDPHAITAKIEQLHAKHEARDVFEEIMPEMNKHTNARAQIFFPYNIHRNHWVTGQIVVNKTNDVYAVRVYAHDPYGAGKMDDKQFSVVRKAIEAKINCFHYKANVKTENEKSGYGPRQNKDDKVSCGVIAVEDGTQLIFNQDPNRKGVNPVGAAPLRRAQYLLMREYQSKTGDHRNISHLLRQKYDEFVHHTLDQYNQLVITRISDIASAQRNLRRLEKWLGKMHAIMPQILLETSSSGSAIRYLNSIIGMLKALVDDFVFLRDVATRGQLIILGNVMALCHGIPDTIKKRFEFKHFQGWQLFSYFANLVAYNYVTDEENTVFYPPQHKLLVANVHRYLDEIPRIYRVLVTIQTVSSTTKKGDVKKTTLLDWGIPAIVDTCQTVANFESLVFISQLIQRAMQYPVGNSIPAKYAFLGCLIQIGEFSKRYSPALRKHMAHTHWEFYRDLRDRLEHPDEEGRYQIVEEFLTDQYKDCDITIEKLQQELKFFQEGIEKTLADFYQQPDMALLQDCKGLLFKEQDVLDSFVVPEEYKLKSNERNNFCSLDLVKTETDHWTQVLSGRLALADKDLQVIQQIRKFHPSHGPILDKVLAIGMAFIQHKINKWSKKYHLPEKQLKQFIDIVSKHNGCDFWFAALNGEVTLTQINKATKEVKLDVSEEKLFNAVIHKIKPLRIHDLLCIFNNKAKGANNLDNKGVVQQILKHLALINDRLHNSLHDEKFMQKVFGKLFNYQSQNFHERRRNLTEPQTALFKLLYMTFPDPNKASDEQLVMMNVLMEKSGLNKALEEGNPLSTKQHLDIMDEYSKQYEEKSSAALQMDDILHHELQYHLTLVFSLVKKLLDQPALIDPEMHPYLERLKKIRNFLAHQDDYTSKIVGMGAHFHVQKLGEDIYYLTAYFQNLLKEFEAKHFVPSSR